MLASTFYNNYIILVSLVFRYNIIYIFSSFYRSNSPKTCSSIILTWLDSMKNQKTNIRRMPFEEFWLGSAATWKFQVASIKLCNCITKTKIWESNYYYLLFLLSEFQCSAHCSQSEFTTYYLYRTTFAWIKFTVYPEYIAFCSWLFFRLELTNSYNYDGLTIVSGKSE